MISKLFAKVASLGDSLDRGINSLSKYAKELEKIRSLSKRLSKNNVLACNLVASIIILIKRCNNSHPTKEKK